MEDTARWRCPDQRLSSSSDAHERLADGAVVRVTGDAVAVEGDDGVEPLGGGTDVVLDRRRRPVASRAVLQVADRSAANGQTDARIVEHDAGTQAERRAGQLHLALAQSTDALVIAIAQHQHADPPLVVPEAQDRRSEE